MPIRLNHVQKDSRSVTLGIGEDTAEIVYKPSAYSPEIESQMRETLDRQMPATALAELLSRVLIRWEIVDEEDNEIPTTLENLRKFPIGLLGQIASLIGDDIGEGFEDRKNSGGGSLQRGK